MDSHWGTPVHRKRKRRRGPDKPPISAHLQLDGRLQGDVGILSDDLFAELFPALAAGQDLGTTNSASLGVRYVAICPRSPSTLCDIETTAWTVIPVKRSSGPSTQKLPAPSTIQFSASSITLKTFLENLQKSPSHTSRVTMNSNLEIFLLDTVPVSLDSVFVTVDEGALEKLEEANRKFHQGHGSGRKTSPTTPQSTSFFHTAMSPAGQRLAAIREALCSTYVVHSGDAISLPVASHPITFVSAPPLLVDFCEPVSQGQVTSKTKIVVLNSGKKRVTSFPAPPSSFSMPNGISEEAEDTSNEQFFSAVEDADSGAEKRDSVVASAQAIPQDNTDSEATSEDDSDASDGEGDRIGMNLPQLTSQPTGVLSAFSSTTPRPGNMFNSGIMSPGSVISTFSTATVLGSASKGRLFEAYGLSAQIPDTILQPKPSRDEDEEARVFVDTTSLVKLGCFSGDWVRVEASHDAFGALNSEPESQVEWRVAKIYALPGSTGRRQRYAVDKTGHRQSIHSLIGLGKPSLRVFLSPVLLANLENPPNIRIASLAPPYTRSSSRDTANRNRITSQSLPPFAKEVTVLKFTTPVATERNMNTSLFTALRKYFEQKRRIVKQGDLIGIPVDGDLGRAVYQGGTGEDDMEQDELLSGVTSPLGSADAKPSSTDIAWFKIGPVSIEPKSEEHMEEENPWGAMAVVRPGITRMGQAGSEVGKLPEAMHSLWPYYLGIKKTQKSASGFAPEQSNALAKQFISPTRRRLRELIAAATSPQAVYLKLPPVAILLASTQRHIGKSTVARSACIDLGLHTFVIDAYDILSEGGAGGGGDNKTEAFLKARAERALTCGPQYTAILVQHIDVLNADRMAGAFKDIIGDSRVLIATTSDVENVPEGVRGLFTHELEMSAPDEGEREGLLRDIVQDSGASLAADVDLSAVAIKTAALVAGDLVDVVSRAITARQDRLRAMANASNTALEDNEPELTIQDIQMAGGDSSRCLTKADFDIAVDTARKNFADAIGAPKIPNVTWDDVGGLNNVKDAVMETIQLPLERPELFAKGMKKRSGILFYGPPGTGKTLLAKAIATEFSLNFFSVKGPELLNMYIGESEANVRRVFQRARDARPCVVFFDELDSVAPKRGNQGDSGGVMDRIVSQLLAELDGMSSGDDSNGGTGGVFVIGATNRPDLLDQALLRPGRFDKMLYLGISDTHEKQLTILEALTRKFTLHQSLTLKSVSELLPLQLTGADLYALCSDAMLKAITRRASAVDAKVRAINSKRAAGADTSSPSTRKQPPITVAYFFDHLATTEDTEVVVQSQDFENAVKELVPSVSIKELEHYDRVRKTFEQSESNAGSGKTGAAAVNAAIGGQNGSSESSRTLRRVSKVDIGRLKGSESASSLGSSSRSSINGEEELLKRTGSMNLDDSDGEDISAHRTNGFTSGKAASGGVSIGKGKAKAPSHATSGDFGVVEDGDEDALYS